MKNLHLFSLIILLGIPAELVYSQSPAEFKARRTEVLNRLEPGSVMILRTSEPGGRFEAGSAGGYFYYLTGIDEPGCMLILRSGNPGLQSGRTPQPKEILFIRPVDLEMANWNAPTTGIDTARTRYGFNDVRPYDGASAFLGYLLNSGIKTIYMEVKKSASINDPLTADEQLIKKARDHGAGFNVLSPGSVMDPMLSIKSDAETALLRRAVSITAEAQREAMRSLKAGMYEYQLDAIIRYVFSVNGSGSLTFPTIIGSGINSVILHWMENSRKMEDGDLVVVDCGAEYKLYGADITRTIPVSGKYTSRQKAIYEIVLKANDEATKAIAPGVRMSVVSGIADSVLADGMVKIGLIKDKRDFKKYYYHGLSHQIGLKGVSEGAPAVLEPGMVITIEPGIYVREEKTGVRIEDDVLVTKTGHEVLSAGAPRTVQDVEKMMKEEGMDVFLKR